MQEPYIYVSYAHRDNEKVQKLIEKLKAMGFRVLYDNGPEAGSDWVESISQKILNSNCLVVFLTENTVQSSSVMQEISFAVSQGKKVVSVCLEDLALSPSVNFQLAGDMIRSDGDAHRLAEKLCALTEVNACRGERKEDFFQTAEIPTVGACEISASPEPQGWFCQTCGQMQDSTTRFCRCCGSPKGAGGYSPVGSRAPDAPYSVASFSDASREILVKEEAPPPPTESRVSPPQMPSMAQSAPSASCPAQEKMQPIAVAAPGKKGLAQRIKGFLGGNKTSDVSFSVLAPATFLKGLYTMVDVYAYEEAFRHVVEQAKAERAKAEGPIKESDGGHLKVRKGTRITVRLTSPDVEIAEDEESRVWEGKYTKFDFPVMLPEDYAKTQILFCATVYFDDVIATRIRFVVSCNSPAPQRPVLKQKDVHSAFISYASGDRERVSLILQGMRRSRPDLDIFFDVETLKTGDTWERILRKEIDSRDVLYLCWSPLAKESKWVDMEWRYALKQKGPDGIEPIPLVLPKDCPPPMELEGKHFGARELFYR